MLKLLFKPILAIYVFLYRLTGGKIGGAMQGLQVLLLTTTGRKTGKKRTTPLGYFEHDGGYVITGSYVAFGAYPGWLYNLKSNSRAAIQVKDQQYEVSAELAGPDKRGQLWARLIEVAPAYANYQKRTTREIPMLILRPVVKT